MSAICQYFDAAAAASAPLMAPRERCFAFARLLCQRALLMMLWH